MSRLLDHTTILPHMHKQHSWPYLIMVMLQFGDSHCFFCSNITSFSFVIHNFTDVVHGKRVYGSNTILHIFFLFFVCKFIWKAKPFYYHSYLICF